MVRSTEDEYIFGVDSLTLLFDKPYCSLDDLGIVIGDLMQIRFSTLMARDDHLFSDLLRIVRHKCCTGLNNHHRRSIVHIEHSLGRRSEVRLEVNNVIHISTREPIDCLPIVSHHKEPCIGNSDESLYEPSHGGGHILKLIGKNV